VANNICRLALVAAISTRNLSTASFSPTHHRIFIAVAFTKLGVSFSPRLFWYFLTFVENALTSSLQWSTAFLAVSHSASNSGVAPPPWILARRSISNRLRSRIQSSLMSDWYSALDPRALSRASTRSLTKRQTDMISPTDPNVIGIMFQNGGMRFSWKGGGLLGMKAILRMRRQAEQWWWRCLPVQPLCPRAPNQIYLPLVFANSKLQN
jgi:hypothetical protein